MKEQTIWPVVLGLHTTTRGFGWVVMSDPKQCVDWDLTYRPPCTDTEGSLEQLKDLLVRFRPEILAIEDWNERAEIHRVRAEPFMQGLQKVACAEGVAVNVHRRSDIRSALGLGPHAKRAEIMRVVMEHLRAFNHRAPRPRYLWDATDRRLSLFLAAAAALATYSQEAHSF